MLFKLSLKNIGKSIKNYAIYFFTLILGVAIFYVFNAIGDQTVMMTVSSAASEAIELMTNLLSGVSVFVSLILAFLIIYANRFLIKRRNKEFGIYLTLGMGKRKISLILFFETLIIGVVSLAVGLAVGTLLSQLMSILVADMFEADLTKFRFVFSSSACVKTLIYFGIMYLAVMVFNAVNISRCRLIDLIHSNKKSEKVKLKNPLLCTVIFFISCIALGISYYLVTGGIGKMKSFDSIFIPITIGAVSTFFIFWSLSGLLLKIFMGMKNVYYKGLNSFTLRQFSSKINTTVFSMTVICLMLFITICVLSSALSMKISMTNNLNKLAPADVQITKKLNLSDTDYYSPEQIENSKSSVDDSLKNLEYSAADNLKDAVSIGIYETESVTLKDTIGSYYKIAKEKYPLMRYNEVETIVKLSDYNKLAKIFGFKQYFLNGGEYILVANYPDYIKFRNEGLKANAELNINGKSYTPKYRSCADGFIEMNATYANMGFFVVPDNAVDDSMKRYDCLTANYSAADEKDKKAADDELRELCDGCSDSVILKMDSKIRIKESSVGLGAMVTFIGLYLGIIFLISCAAVLALKELSESSDNAEKFSMLRKLGADEKTINKALFSQIGIFFMFPLIIAVIHSVFGIKFCSYILSSFGRANQMASVVWVALFIVAIYGGYFLVTYICSKNIIKERKSN